MAKATNRRLSVRTEKGAVFTRHIAEDAQEQHELWELTAHGISKRIYAAYVSKERADTLEQLYVEDRRGYDIASERYLESLKRLIKVGRDESFSGDSGVVIQLAQGSGQYYLAFHKGSEDSPRPDTFDPDHFATEMARKDSIRRTKEPDPSQIDGSEGKPLTSDPPKLSDMLKTPPTRRAKR